MVKKYVIEGRNKSLNSAVVWWMSVSWTIVPHLLFLDDYDTAEHFITARPELSGPVDQQQTDR